MHRLRQTRTDPAWHCLALALALSTWAGGASAQGTVVLGLQSEDGDDDIARDLSQALREQAAELTDWRLSDSQPSLFQMTMAHDCDAKNDACLAQIAGALDASQLVLGTMRRTSDGQIRVEASLFGTEAGARSASADAQLADTQTDPGSLAAVARQLIQPLAGLEPPPPEPLPAGPPVVAAPSELTPMQARPEDVEGYRDPDAQDGSLAWLGYGLVGVAVASAGMAVFSWVQIDSANTDADFDAYRRAAGRMDPSVPDVCDAAKDGERYGVDPATYSGALDQCDQGEAFEVLQYVFLGTAVVSGGLGLWLILDDESGSETAAGGRGLALTPRVGPGSARFEASLRF